MRGAVAPRLVAEPRIGAQPRLPSLEIVVTGIVPTLTVLEPAPHVLGFYDGRVPGVRLHGPEPNWLDDGAYSLGTCTYAIVRGDTALVYDTHMSLPHARRLRQILEERGVTRFVVVLSHWHKDHVAGNAAFADCEIIAGATTAKLLAENRAAIESANPPIRPLVMPTRIVDGEETLTIGDLTVALRPADIHSIDGLVLFLPERGLLFAGDTMEDPVTYVTEPARLHHHLAELARIATWPVAQILPNHGDPDVIARGGYDPRLIAATRRYVERLLRARGDDALAAEPLSAWIADDVAAGILHPIEAYNAVHRHNADAVRGL